MTNDELRELISSATALLESRDHLEASRHAVISAVEDYATLAGITVIQAWRDLAPEGVEVPTDPEPEPQPAPLWVQPQAHNPYMLGDRVSFRGSTYESTMDNNVWSPAAYPMGWRQIS